MLPTSSLRRSEMQVGLRSRFHRSRSSARLDRFLDWLGGRHVFLRYELTRIPSLV